MTLGIWTVSMNRSLKLAILGLVALVAVASLNGQKPATPQPKVYHLEGAEGTHDPSIAKEGDTWYVFATITGKDRQGELPVRCSKDLEHWSPCGFVFKQIPDWIKKESPDTKELWAPDISYFDGKFHLYYAFSAFGVNTSGIALLTNKTLNTKSPDYRWEDQGLVLRSLKQDNFNAIDPNLILDDKGGAWLAFGSFWNGIKMRKIDPKTGKLDEKDTTLYSLANRVEPPNAAPAKPGLPPDWQAIEAPFIVRHGEYYYLFVSLDMCCRGTKSTYKIMVGRSRNPNGPYSDADGKLMTQGGGTLLLDGNARWLGPGGESVLQGKDADIMVFHAYDGQTGHPSLQISSIVWADGWPHVAMEGPAK